MERTTAKRIASIVMSLGGATAAAAAAPSFQIIELYSNLDGTYQFIQLQETAGMNGQHHFAGLTLTSNHNGIAKQITFPLDLPDDQTANQTVLIATDPGVPYYTPVPSAYGETEVFPGDFLIPPRFIPTDGGTIDFAGVDQVSYPALPYDGWRGWFRDGTVGAVGFSGFHRPTPPLGDPEHPVAQYDVSALEYYNAELDHYFVTASAPDIDAIESGRTQGWARTAVTFQVIGGPFIYAYPSAADFPDAVCRFYIPPAEGNSHFYSASAEECALVRARFPEFDLESSSVFYVRLPNLATGECPTLPGYSPGFGKLQPVFRLWNHRVDSNHRYVTDLALRDRMIQQGYIPEGYGSLGVAFCVF